MIDDVNTLTKVVIILVLLYLIWILLNKCKKNKKEGFDETNPLNTEAIQNISSIYNNDLLKISNIETTGTITSSNINSLNIINETLTSDIITSKNIISEDLTINNNKAILSNKQYKTDTGIYTGLNDTGNGTIKFNIKFTKTPNVFFNYIFDNVDARYNIYIRKIDKNGCDIKCVGSSGKGRKIPNVLWFAIGE